MLLVCCAVEIRPYRRFRAFSAAVLIYFSVVLLYLGLLLVFPVSLLLMIVLVAPVVEESVKGSFCRILGTASFSLGVCVGAGFAFVENISYLLFYSGVEGLYFIRIFGMVLHSTATGLVYYGISRERKWRYLVLAMVLHGLYNAFFPALWDMVN